MSSVPVAAFLRSPEGLVAAEPRLPCPCDLAVLCEGGYPCPQINPEDVEYPE